MISRLGSRHTIKTFENVVDDSQTIREEGEEGESMVFLEHPFRISDLTVVIRGTRSLGSEVIIGGLHNFYS